MIEHRAIFDGSKTLPRFIELACIVAALWYLYIGQTDVGTFQIAMATYLRINEAM